MKRCRTFVFSVILLLIFFSLSQVSQSDIRVRLLLDAATLPCNQTVNQNSPCSVRVIWTVLHKPHDILTQCNQTSCRAKEGFHMSHDQYLKGDFSLTITDADYTKRTLYTCKCDGRDLCDVRLRLKPPTYNISVQPGESLIMDVPISEPVVVLFNQNSDASPQTILCEIKGRRIQKSNSEYEKRVSFSSSLQLNEMKESDSGVYTIKDTKKEVIATYRVSVNVLPQASLNPVIKVKHHDAATLSCNQTCSGLVTWTVFHKQHDILAQCNQTSCRVKEGFHMSHDQYLKGNFSLTFTNTDYTKRAWYTFECVGTDFCDVRLRLKPPTYHISVQPGESLIMDVPISEPVVVLFNRTNDDSPQTVILRETEGRTFQNFNSECEKRVSFSSSLQLNEMKESDSGVYTIRDTKNDEVIATYRVSVNDPEPDLSRGVIWTLVILLILLLLLPLIGLLYGRAVWMKSSQAKSMSALLSSFYMGK